MCCENAEHSCFRLDPTLSLQLFDERRHLISKWVSEAPFAPFHWLYTEPQGSDIETFSVDGLGR